jgi:hypothetical protein
VVDVSDPTNPTVVGFYETPGSASDVEARGHYAYVADGDAGFRVVDVSDPANPTEVGSCLTPAAVNHVAIDGRYAYAAGNQAGLRLVDVSDPVNPVEVGYFDPPGDSIGTVAAGSGHVYLADGYPETWGGVFILRNMLVGHQASGMVQLDNGTPLPGVTVSAGPGYEAITDATGVYTITGLMTGTHTLTPSLTEYIFFPPTRTVTVPPDATGQDFVAVPNVPVEADFTGQPTAGLPPLTVVFTNTSVGDYDTSLWLFGDGVTSTLPGPTHTYPAAGVYTVTLAVDGPGGADTEVKPRYITVQYGTYLPVILRGP